MRTLIYARYSSQLQNPRSIADQLAACRARCAAEGWEIAGEYSDAATSGAAGMDADQRPGLFDLLAHLERPGAAIGQVLAEATDRLARHQGDDFAIRERIAHAGARLFTLMQGPVDDVTGTLHGLFAARTRQDLAARVRRGHKGNIAQGRAASGVAYGYRKVTDRHDARGEQIKGLREIDPETSEIVRRIFADYAAGRSARQIALDLNRQGIPAPRGGIWRASTIAGHRRDGFGILANPIYIGRLVYGRTRAVTDPKTRRKSMRQGEEPRTTGEADHLRLIDDALWQAVQQQLEARSSSPSTCDGEEDRTKSGGGAARARQRRPKHLLSGLAQCHCGANWIVTRDSYLGCSRAIDGACTNRRLIRRAELEARVLAELTGQMLAPEVVAAYLAEYRAEHARRARDLARERGALERRRADAMRKVANLVEFIANGDAIPELRARLAQAKADQAAAEKALAAADALPTLALHPGLERQYRTAISNLAEELADETTRREAAPKLRALIARVIVTPTAEKRGVHLEVVRHIDEIATLAGAPIKQRA